MVTRRLSKKKWRPEKTKEKREAKNKPDSNQTIHLLAKKEAWHELEKGRKLF